MIQLFDSPEDNRELAKAILTAAVFTRLVALASSLLLQPLSATSISRDAVSAFSYVIRVALIAAIAAYLLLWPSRKHLFLNKTPLALTFVSLCLWMPPAVIFCRDRDLAGILAAALAVASAKVLRRFWNPLTDDTSQSHFSPADYFSELSPGPGMNLIGLTIMVCGCYGGLAAWAAGKGVLALLLIAASCFYLGWSKEGYIHSTNPTLNPRSKRIALYITLSVLVTFIGLLPSLPEILRRQTDEKRYKLHQNDPGDEHPHAAVILLPFRKPALAFIPPHHPKPSNSLAHALPKTTSIIFSGEYWFMRPPAHHPSSAAFRELGDPTSIEITMEDIEPLVMEARQPLATPLSAHCCSSISMVLNSEEKQPTLVDVELILMNSSIEQPNAQTLGSQSLATAVLDSTGRSTLRFPFPSHSAIRNFTELAIWFDLKPPHRQRAASVAIERFDLTP